jgi:hypothetical protein
MCCGQKRAAIATPGASITVAQTAKTAAPAAPPAAVAMSVHPPVLSEARPCFEYIGDTALIVIGPATGNRYHFAGPGQRVPVDERDGASLALIRQLAHSAGC